MSSEQDREISPTIDQEERMAPGLERSNVSTALASEVSRKAKDRIPERVETMMVAIRKRKHPKGPNYIDKIQTSLSSAAILVSFVGDQVSNNEAKLAGSVASAVVNASKVAEAVYDCAFRNKLPKHPLNVLSAAVNTVGGTLSGVGQYTGQDTLTKVGDVIQLASAIGDAYTTAAEKKLYLIPPNDVESYDETSSSVANAAYMRSPIALSPRQISEKAVSTPVQPTHPPSLAIRSAQANRTRANTI